MSDVYKDIQVRLPIYLAEALAKAAEDACVEEKVFIGELLAKVHETEETEGLIAQVTLNILERLEESTQRVFGEEDGR